MEQNKHFQSKQIRRGGQIICFLILCAAFCSKSIAQIDTTHPQILEGISITTTRPSGESTFSVSNVSRDDIEEKHGNGSINNILDQVPGMVTTSDAGTGIGYSYMRIRGIDQTRINVTINGVALNDAESQGSWFCNVPDFGSHVQHLEVQRGAGTSNNGSSAFGATMNFTTMTPSDKPFAWISSSFGSFQTFRNSVSAGTGLIKNRFSAQAGYSNILSNGYINYSSANLHSAFFSAKYHLFNQKKNHDYGTLQFNLLYGNEKTGLAWDGVPSDSLSTNRRYNACGLYYDNEGNLQHYDNETDNYQQTHAQLHYNFSKRINAIHKVQLRAALHLTRGIGYYEQYKDDAKYSKKYGLAIPDSVRGDAITRKYLDNYFYGGIFNFEHTIKDRYTWMVGGSVNRYAGKHYGTIEWLELNSAIPFGHHWYDGFGDKRQYNVYAKFITDFRYLQRGLPVLTTIYADLQYRFIDYRITGTDDNLLDISQSHLWSFINPKVGVNHRWNRTDRINNEVYFTFSVANREPTRADLTESDSTNRPKPETLYDFEAGYLCRGKNFQASATAYFMYYTDQLVLTGEINNVGAAIMTNAPKSYRTGIELIASYQPCKWFTMKVNGTFSINKIIDYTEYVDDWDNGGQVVNYIGNTNISFSPNIVASDELIFTPVKNFDIAWVTKFVSRQYIDNSSKKEYSIDPYCLNHLQLSYKIHTKAIPEIALFFHINNIFNAQYESNAWLYRYYSDGKEEWMNGYFPQAGINFMGGITLKF